MMFFQRLLLGFAVLCGLCSFARAGDVTLADHSTSVTLGNGIVTAEFDMQSGDLLHLRYAGKEILERPAYWDVVADRTGETDKHMIDGKYSLRVDPKSNHGEMAEICVSRTYDGTGAAFDIELHHVLRRGDSGFYTYVIFSHPASYPPAYFAQSRFVIRVADELFNFVNIDDQRRTLMPAPKTAYKPLGPKESMLITEGPFKGVIEDKYHNFADAGDHFVHGWTGTTSNLGCFILYGSNEDMNGGPTKQHNTAHFGNVLLKILTCGHYGAAGVDVKGGEWQKIYGPWMVYLNHADSNDALWADAKQKAQTERAAWPYAWMKNDAYPLAADRGTVKGRLKLADPQDPGASPAGAWVGLAAPSPDWQAQSLGYQFWVHADRDGNFQIPNVREGSYALYAFVDGVMDEFRRDNLVVSKGKTIDLSTLEWKPVRHGRQLWQIGKPDRTAKEFRHGDDYRQWGLWLKYPQEFPNGVNFIIGKSNERTDWNYAQVNVQKDGEWVGTTWEIQFNMSEPPKPGEATLRLAIAAAQAPVLAVSVNGKQVANLRGIGEDNAMMRAGIHGQYTQRDVTFDARLLKPGANTISLEQRGARSQQKNIMYDCLRLEVPE
jgi:rhamnogalacturonan endolyase